MLCLALLQQVPCLNTHPPSLVKGRLQARESTSPLCGVSLYAPLFSNCWMPYEQGSWAALRWLSKKRGTCCCQQQRMVWVPCRASGQPFWSFILPDRFIYSSDLGDVDTEQLSELWAKTLDVTRDPQEIAKALKHSYTLVVVLEQVEEMKSSMGFPKRLVGFGRAVSDGAFIATICDVAVDPAYQKRGIGRRIVKELVKDMKQRGGPTGFAVFPPPRVRRFFWTIGFRSDKQFRFMTYRGRLVDSTTQEEDRTEPK